MLRKATWMAAVCLLAGPLAWAQEARVEIGATAGWTFSDGVGGANAVVVPGVGTFTRIDPKDAFSWGLRLGFMVNENVEVGGLFNQQSTSLEISGTGWGLAVSGDKAVVMGRNDGLPQLRMRGDLTLGDTTRGVISRPAYQRHLAQQIASAVSDTLKKQVYENS